MKEASLLIIAMAEECKQLILKSTEQDVSLPEPLQSDHLLRMCDKIGIHAEDWPATKLHRWIGFVQCAMLANQMLDLEGAKSMFDKAKVAYGESSEDLRDHLDPTSYFEVDIGGEG